MLGDPIVTKYDNDYLLLSDATTYILTEKPDSDCRFKVSVKVGYYGQGGLLVPDYLEIEMDKGAVVLQLIDDHYVKYISPADGEENANSSTYSKQVTANVRVYRNDDFIVVEDTKCLHKVGYDSEGLGTKATIVVDSAIGTYLTGQCGKCDEE